MRDGPSRSPPLRAASCATVLGLAISFSSGCALLPSMDGFTGSAVDAGGGTATTGGDGGDAGDASEAGTKPVCTNGHIGGLHAFDATPAGAKAIACDIDNALVADGQVTGLAATDYGGAVPLAGVQVHSCVGVDFEAPLKLVYLRVARAASACGQSCLTTFCGQGDYVEIFAGPSRDQIAFVKELTTGATLAELSQAVPAGTRTVVVCRFGGSKDKDHVAVDAITAACP